MKDLAVPFALSTEKSFFTGEKNRKIKLLKLFCLIIVTLAISTIAISFCAPFLQSTFDLSTPLIFAILLVNALISYRLAQRGQLYQGSWLLIGSYASVLAVIYWQYGTTIPMYAAFLLPIAAASTLMSRTQVVILAGICMVFSASLIIAERILEVYNPPLSFDNTVIQLFFVFAIVPALIALILLPNKAQARALEVQNKRLIKTLEKLQARQQVIEEVSHLVAGLSSQLKVSANQQATGSQEQAATVLQINSSMREVATTSAQITEIARQVSTSGLTMAQDSQQIEETSYLSANRSQQGTEAVKRSVAASQEVAEVYQELTHLFAELSHKSENMSKVLDLLKNITDETHLLSLNAAIEAAGAGEYGTRFAVVAQEVKNLALSAGKAQGVAVQAVHEIEEVTALAVKAVTNGYAKAKAMETITEEAGKVIEELSLVAEKAHSQATAISATAQQVKQLSETILVSTDQQGMVSQQVSSALTGLSMVAQQSAASSEQVLGTVQELETMAKKLRDNFSD